MRLLCQAQSHIRHHALDKLIQRNPLLDSVDQSIVTGTQTDYRCTGLGKVAAIGSKAPSTRLNAATQHTLQDRSGLLQPVMVGWRGERRKDVRILNSKPV